MMSKNGVQIGYGVTAWANGAVRGHLDGIGVYTQALYQALARAVPSDDAQITPCAFGAHTVVLPCGAPLRLASRISVHLLLAALFRRRVRCPVDVFHATDHHIPLLRGVPVVATVMD